MAGEQRSTSSSRCTGTDIGFARLPPHLVRRAPESAGAGNGIRRPSAPIVIFPVSAQSFFLSFILFPAFANVYPVGRTPCHNRRGHPAARATPGCAGRRLRGAPPQSAQACGEYLLHVLACSQSAATESSRDAPPDTAFAYPHHRSRIKCYSRRLRPHPRGFMTGTQGVYVKWLRIVVWAILITLAVNLPLIFIWSMPFWKNFGISWSSLPAIKIIGVWILPALLYWRFAAALTQRRPLHVAALFAAAQLCQTLLVVLLAIVIAMIFEAPLLEDFNVSSLIDRKALVPAAIVAAIGYGLAWLLPRRPVKVRTLRDLANGTR